MAKYIFVTGGVVSSLGKGIAAASIAKLLESLPPGGNRIRVVLRQGYERLSVTSQSLRLRHGRFDPLVFEKVVSQALQSSFSVACPPAEPSLFLTVPHLLLLAFFFLQVHPKVQPHR